MGPHLSFLFSSGANVIGKPVILLEPSRKNGTVLFTPTYNSSPPCSAVDFPEYVEKQHMGEVDGGDGLEARRNRRRNPKRAFTNKMLVNHRLVCMEIPMRRRTALGWHKV
jgi:hypothetical protein